MPTTMHEQILNPMNKLLLQPLATAPPLHLRTPPSSSPADPPFFSSGTPLPSLLLLLQRTPPPLLLNTSGKTHRFAAGTKAGYSLSFINNKLLQIQAKSRTHLPLSSHIQSVKDGEKPVVFGPTATLVDYGQGWKLMSVADSVVLENEGGDKGLFADSEFNFKGPSKPISLVYLGKILAFFILMFLFGALCTLFLENIPELILYIGQFT